MAFLAGVAAAAAALSVEESWKTLIALELLAVLFATASVVLMRETNGKLQTFWVGTAVVFSLAAIMAGASLPFFSFLISRESGSGDEFVRTWGRLSGTIGQLLGAFWCVAPINGVFAVLIQLLFCSRQKPPN